MNHSTATCGHAIIAVGAPNSPARLREESRPCGECRTRAIELLRAAVAQHGRRWEDCLFGPWAAELRRQIASAIHGRELVKSHKLCQFGEVRRALWAALDAQGDCIAARDRDAAEKLGGGFS